MTETVDQAQAQPPRALAGVIEDATSLSFVPASHFEGSRGRSLARVRICCGLPGPWAAIPGLAGKLSSSTSAMTAR